MNPQKGFRIVEPRIYCGPFFLQVFAFRHVLRVSVAKSPIQSVLMGGGDVLFASGELCKA
jgi:hypothetical protein